MRFYVVSIQALIELSGEAGKALLGAKGSANSTAGGAALHTALPAAVAGIPYHVAALADGINVEVQSNLDISV